MMADAPRRFPPPWRAEKMPGGYVVRDANGRARDRGRGAASEHALIAGEARRIVENIARLLDLLRRENDD
jgi:hypothetical protein